MFTLLVVFSTWAFTSLIMTWIVASVLIRNSDKAKKYARRHKFCHSCGISFMVLPRQNTKKKQPLGYNLDGHGKGDEHE